MKLIIEIPEMAYNAYKEWHKNKVATVEQSLIANGTPYEERLKGEWKFVFDDKVNNRFIYQCSECGREVSVYSSDALIPVYPYCHCGAKMQTTENN